MLCLSRKIDDEIRINDDVTIKILEISGGRVRLGLTAPKETRIFRGEIYDAMQSETQDSSGKVAS